VKQLDHGVSKVYWTTTFCFFVKLTRPGSVTGEAHGEGRGLREGLGV